MLPTDERHHIEKPVDRNIDTARRESPMALIDIIACLSEAMDLVHPSLRDHHLRVAYCSLKLAEELGLPPETQQEIIFAGSLHDCGALSLKEKMDALHFEANNPHHHAELSYKLLNPFKPLKTAAEISRFHHVNWEKGEGAHFRGLEVPEESHLVHLADRIAVLISRKDHVLNQVEDITRKIEEKSDIMFMAPHVEAFLSLSKRECFFLDLASTSLKAILRSSCRLEDLSMDGNELLPLTRLFSHIIDFRSSFTACHSSGVATSAEAIGRILGFPAHDAERLRIAGYLHDIGKLAVPSEILEAPRALTIEERNIMNSHSYHTYRVLEPLVPLRTIATWASYHHEHLDGRGYPFHLKEEELSREARILAVADVFTAITEDRPYRKGMDRKETLRILSGMSDNHKLDKDIVLLVADHFDDINSYCKDAEHECRETFAHI
jgi:HD-GYP domain-containing protein (c-di-GMP phosphodiesterase class II)